MAVMASDISRAYEWLQKFHVKADALDPRPWMSLFTPDAILNYANSPTLTGHEEIIAAMEQSMSGLRSMKHEIGHIDVTPERIYQEAKITYVIKGDPTGEELVVKGFAVVHKGVGEERLRRLDIYGDFSEVYGRMAEVRKGAEGKTG